MPRCLCSDVSKSTVGWVVPKCLCAEVHKSVVSDVLMYKEPPICNLSADVTYDLPNALVQVFPSRCFLFS